MILDEADRRSLPVLGICRGSATFSIRITDVANRLRDLTSPKLDQLHAPDNALRSARSELSPDVSAQRLLILICVYLNQGLSQREPQET